MRILLLNQYFPPDAAPTGILLAELGERLRKEGHEVTLVSGGEPYRAGQTKQKGRMRRELAALLRILMNGLCAPRANIVVSASSPPMLLVIATLVAMRHGARSVHWAMDLYPELALALDEIRPGLLSTLCTTLMRWCYRHAARVVALDEDMAAHLRTYGVAPRICRPWIFESVLPRWRVAMAQNPFPEEPWTWVYSGNLGRAHEWETLLEAQRLVEERDSSIRLLFQGGGPSWPAARKRAEVLGLRRCEWRGYVAEEDLPASLLRCAVGIATQRPETAGLLWPSKLGLLLALPRAILWIGCTSSSIAALIAKNPRNGVFAPGAAQQVADWILQQRDQPAPFSAAENPAQIRADALDWWVATLDEVAGERRTPLTAAP